MPTAISIPSNASRRRKRCRQTRSAKGGSSTPPLHTKSRQNGWDPGAITIRPGRTADTGWDLVLDPGSYRQAIDALTAAPKAGEGIRGSYFVGCVKVGKCPGDDRGYVGLASIARLHAVIVAAFRGARKPTPAFDRVTRNRLTTGERVLASGGYAGPLAPIPRDGRVLTYSYAISSDGTPGPVTYYHPRRAILYQEGAEDPLSRQRGSYPRQGTAHPRSGRRVI